MAIPLAFAGVAPCQPEEVTSGGEGRGSVSLLLSSPKGGVVIVFNLVDSVPMSTSNQKWTLVSDISKKVHTSINHLYVSL